MTLSKNRYYAFFIIFSIVIFHAINNYFVLAASCFSNNPDAIIYFKGARSLLEAIKINTGNIWGLPLVIWKACFNGMHTTIRSPFFYLLTLPVININMNMNWAIMSNMIYFCVLLFSVYGLGKELYDSRGTGVLAAFLVSFFPGIFAMSRCYFRDFALTACLALNAYLFVKLLKSKGRNIFILFFLAVFSIFAGLLIKESYAYFLPLFPLFLLTTKEYGCKSNAVKIILAVILGLAFSLIWYLNLDLRYIYAAWKSTVVSYDTSIDDVMFYVKRLYAIQLMPLFFIFFMLSIIYYFRKKSVFLVITVVLPLIIFSFGSTNKDGRFILPLFIFIALAIAWTVHNISVKWKNITISAIIIFSFWQFFWVTYGNAFSPREDRWQSDGLYGIVNMPNYKKTASSILNIIKISYNPRINSKNASIIVLDKENELYWAMEEVSADSMENIFQLERHYPDFNCDDMPLTGQKIKEDVLDYDYVVCIRPADFTWKNAISYYGNFIRNKERFVLVDTVAHSSEVQFDIYKRKE
jgi:4-amino-4-deoxy-L-arabinose transferase-like glycosyltransferase